jgi:hypothetical protein
MRAKLILNLEDLSVDSFDTTAAEKPRGTVFGEQCTCYTVCTCPGCPTCDVSCNGTCPDTCANTCQYTCDDYSCAWTCAGNTCEVYTCDPGYCRLSQKYTNCNNICY